jgi:hypothetical protein
VAIAVLLPEEDEGSSDLAAQELSLSGPNAIFASASDRGASAGESRGTRSEARSAGAANSSSALGALSDVLAFDASQLFDRLDRLEDSLEANQEMLEWAIGTAATATTVLTTGYVVWLVRGGYLFAGLLSSLPTWYRLDPLPVLQTRGPMLAARRRDEEDDSLVEIVEETTRHSAPAEDRNLISSRTGIESELEA